MLRRVRILQLVQVRYVLCTRAPAVGVLYTRAPRCRRAIYTGTSLQVCYIHGHLAVGVLYTGGPRCRRAIYTGTSLQACYIHKHLALGVLYTRAPRCRRAIYTDTSLQACYIHGNIAVGVLYTRAPRCRRVIYTSTSLWVCCPYIDLSVLRSDPRTGRVILGHPSWVCYFAHLDWVCNICTSHPECAMIVHLALDVVYLDSRSGYCKEKEIDRKMNRWVDEK